MTYSLAKVREALMGSLFADTAAAEKPHMGFALDMLSDWLPYRVFDESAGLYRNARSKGFILEVTPLIGADERTGEILGQFFSEGLPEGPVFRSSISPARGSGKSSHRGSRRVMSRAGSTRRSRARGSRGSTISSGKAAPPMRRSMSEAPG